MNKNETDLKKIRIALDALELVNSNYDSITDAGVNLNEAYKEIMDRDSERYT